MVSFFGKQNKQDLKQQSAKVEPLKLTTQKNCIFRPFVDTNTHLTTKTYNFDIASLCHSESNELHGCYGTNFGGGQNFVFLLGSLINKRDSSFDDPLISLMTDG